MRKLKRILTPIGFSPKYHGQDRKDAEFELLQNRQLQKRGIDKKIYKDGYWKDAKPRLIEESLGKCAYCESNFQTVAYGDVEHYRPKSIYWWLSNSYHNFSAACTLCNRKFKSNKFEIAGRRLKEPTIAVNWLESTLRRKAGNYTTDPLDNNSGLPLNTFITNHERERPLGIDPYIDSPEDFFGYQIIEENAEVHLIPLTDSSIDIANGSIDLFGLNRPELLRSRYYSLRLFREITTAFEISDNPTVKQILRRVLDLFLEEDIEYCAMFKYYNAIPNIPLPKN